ncbi:hypothetical protein HAZT_HAZT010521 [Hyalella azteca]|uniref:2Fe-2S ferredoxin-type domain-containing protein n=1 Tax=Hyalella azteca TaxID=294128 RepID=A0A6A0HD51_HYAAZ|nr:hypothetical protein HAZT_HAZT010521 [Hyalella azteca]
MGDSIQVTINGKLYVVGAEESISTRLVTFIRDKVGTGTHITCYQGGCGACTVVATAPDAATGGTKTFSINSCLASLYNCDGWSITTIEGLGNREDGYHVIQERLAEYYGTQCGYCSPAMVMNMYGLTQEKGTWTDDDVEKHLDGHICRCTGYRPILAAFKSITPADIEVKYRLLSAHIIPHTRSLLLHIFPHTRSLILHILSPIQDP